MIDKFIKENRKFWSQFTIKNEGKKLLVEEGRIYRKAILSMVVNQAKGYVPVWLNAKDPQQRQLIQSYFPDIEFIATEKIYIYKKIYATIVALFKFVKILILKNILELHYDKVKYGDIIYDMYLSKNQVATIKKIDFKLLKIIATYVFQHIKIKNILQNGNYAAVLVSHMVGSSGVMLRTALRYGYEGYLCTGWDQDSIIFQRFKKLEEIVFPLKPSEFDIRKIIDQLGSRFKKFFLETLKNEVAGTGSIDGLNAFSKKNKYYTNRAFFNKDHGLNFKKKNVFIMLHAFNDHPHSVFDWMIFKDYYDWFIQTLEFAKNNNKVNWIFKQHPSVKWWPTKDVDFKKLFSRCSDNVIYIDENKQIDTRSLIHCADSIVTCLGSAGFELPAMAAIPSITAGDNAYAGLGFALEPKTKKEYFEILNKINKIEKLTPQAQKKARAVYIYIKRISKVKISILPDPSSPGVTGVKEKDKIIKPEYWEKACNQYSSNKDVVLKELNYYIKAVRRPKFKKLISKI